MRASGELDVSSAASAPRPPVRSRIAGRCVVGARVDRLPRAERLGPRQAFRAHVQRDHPRSHGGRQLRGGEPDRPLAEDRDGVVARKIGPAQRAIRRPRAARDGGARGERQPAIQGQHGVRRHFQVLRVAAMGVVAIHLDRHVLAKLGPAGPAMAAMVAALVVVDHHPLADMRQAALHPRADRRDHARRFVPHDHRLQVDRQPGGGGAAALLAAVLVQVAAAHAGRLHLDHHLARAGRGVGEVHDLEFALAVEHHAAHGPYPFPVRACPGPVAAISHSPSPVAQSPAAQCARAKSPGR